MCCMIPGMCWQTCKKNYSHSHAGFWDMTRHLPDEKKNPKKRTVQIINLTPTSTEHISLTFLPLCWEKVIGCVQVCMELDRSVFFPGPLGAWYGKNVPHYGGKFLHCQHEPTVGFHNRHLHVMGSANMLSFLFFLQVYYPRRGFLDTCRTLKSYYHKQNTEI